MCKKLKSAQEHDSHFFLSVNVYIVGMISEIGQFGIHCSLTLNKFH